MSDADTDGAQAPPPPPPPAPRKGRAGAWLVWGLALFLAAGLTGALAWGIVLKPAWLAASARGDLSVAFVALGDRVLVAVVRAAPAVLLTLGAWEAAGVASRVAHGRAARASVALGHIGLSVFLAGAMAVFGTPSLLVMLETGGWAWRLALEPLGVSLAVLGLVMMLGRAAAGKA